MKFPPKGTPHLANHDGTTTIWYYDAKEIDAKEIDAWREALRQRIMIVKVNTRMQRDQAFAASMYEHFMRELLEEWLA